MTVEDDNICIPGRPGMPVCKDVAILCEGHDPDLPHAGYQEEDEWITPGTSGQDMFQPSVITEGAWKVLLLGIEGPNVNLVVLGLDGLVLPLLPGQLPLPSQIFGSPPSMSIVVSEVWFYYGHEHLPIVNAEHDQLPSQMGGTVLLGKEQGPSDGMVHAVTIRRGLD